MNDTAIKRGGEGGATRRDFLKGVVITGGAAALGLGAAPAPAVQGDAAGSDPRAPSGYRETRHVRDYYRSARMI